MSDKMLNMMKEEKAKNVLKQIMCNLMEPKS